MTGEWPEELDSLLSTENVVRVSLGGSNWGSKDKVTPTKVAQWILALVNDLNLDSVSLLAAAGAGTVALACAKLMATDRLQSVGIIAGKVSCFHQRQRRNAGVREKSFSSCCMHVVAHKYAY